MNIIENTIERAKQNIRHIDVEFRGLIDRNNRLRNGSGRFSKLGRSS